MNSATEDLRASVSGRAEQGWRMPTGVAELQHELSGDYLDGSAWDLLTVGVLWVPSLNRWQVLGHRWTTEGGWQGRRFFTFDHPHVVGTAADALDAAAALLARAPQPQPLASSDGTALTGLSSSG
jgi:hypothetical protein